MADQDKLRTLQKQGTLNPRPKAVRDDLFLQDDFFDTRDLVQVKYEMLRRVRTDGKSVSDAAAKLAFPGPLSIHPTYWLNGTRLWSRN